MRAAIWIGVSVWASAVAAQVPPTNGHVVSNTDFSDAQSPAWRERISRESARHVDALRAGGRYSIKALAVINDLQWPLKPVASFDQFDYHGTKYFVDHDPRYPGLVQDYTCGTRTYDLDTGYNHAGTDYYLWPFPWLMMDRGLVQIVAAAPGVIADKADGNFDRDCAIASGTDPNFVSVRQDDGLTAIYLHMRSGSVTTLPIGTRIAAGDYLGLVGSSGQSSGPHLHFELRDANNAVVDPRHGMCNDAPDRWAVFQPYEDPHIDTLSTHSADPLFVDCGVDDAGNAVDETPYYQDRFTPGSPVWVFASYRDQRNGEVTNFSILRPDGSTFAQWDFDLASENEPAAFYSGTAWDWQYTLPADAPGGTWQFRADFQGQTYVHEFAVAASPFDPGAAGRDREQVGARAVRCRPQANGSSAPGCP